MRRLHAGRDDLVSCMPLRSVATHEKSDRGLVPTLLCLKALCLGLNLLLYVAMILQESSQQTGSQQP